jgi:hypothetical protein
MPSVSPKQRNLMAMVAHDASASQRLGIPQSVGEEFVHADQASGTYHGRAPMEGLKRAGKHHNSRHEKR